MCRADRTAKKHYVSFEESLPDPSAMFNAIESAALLNCELSVHISFFGNFLMILLAADVNFIDF